MGQKGTGERRERGRTPLYQLRGGASTTVIGMYEEPCKNCVEGVQLRVVLVEKTVRSTVAH